MQHAPRPSHYRADIDGLRALAVMAVIGFHAFPETVRGGFIGVDVFFVISGYLISQLLLRDLQDGTFSLTGFYARRIQRIFPALLLVLAACYLFGWFTLFTDEFAQLGKHIAGGAGFASNLVLWGESGYFDKASELKPLMHLWSLGIEEQFYIVWPILLWAAWRWKLGTDRVLLVLAAASFAVNIWLRADMATDFYAPFTRFWELLLGAALATTTLQQKEARSYLLLSLIGVALLVTGMIIIRASEPYPGLLAAVPTVGTALLIAGGSGNWINRLLGWRGLAAIGRISYPLYLWHWPLLSFSYIIASEALSTQWRWAMIAATFVLAYGTYVLVERPLRFGGSRRAKIAFLIGAMLVIGLLGYDTYRRDGYGFRAVPQEYVNNAPEFRRTASVDKACLQYLGVSESPTNYCRFSNAGGSRTVAIIGDSYAHAAYPGMAEALAMNGTNALLLGNYGCPPLQGSPLGVTEDERTRCAQHTKALLETVTSRADVGKIFIFSRGPTYMMPSASGGAALLTPAQFFGTLQTTIDRLQDAGKKIYYVVETPEPGIDPITCQKRPLRPTTQPCIIARYTVMEQQAEYRELVQQLQHATLIDPLDTFCTDTTCRMIDNSVLLYADRGHLSVAGSRYLTKHVLKPYLMP